MKKNKPLETRRLHRKQKQRRPKMGKGSGGSNLIKLRRRLEQFIKHRESSSIDEIVHHLRNNFPDYNRIKLNELNRLVEKTLYSFDRRTKTPPIPTPIILHAADGDGGGGGSGSRNRLQEIENEHIRKKHRTDHDRPSTSDGGDDAVSTTSEDAVERELDLTKSRLRARYMKSNSVTITRKAATSDEKNKIDISILPNESERELDSVSKSKALSMVKGNKCLKCLKFKDLGGMEKVVMELTKQFLVPLCHPRSVRLLGMKPMAGILLHGPPGCGKTTLAHAIANETGLPFYPISSTELVSGVSRTSEENIRELFQKAYRTAPSIVFIDEIDAIASKRENLQRQMDQRIVTQLITCMDELHRPTIANSDSQSNSDYTSAGYVLVIGATNRPDAIDPALRRPGRFSREIELGVPDEKTRAEILVVLTRNLRLRGSFDLLKIARSTAGFVGTDLANLVDSAANLALNRVIDEGKALISKDSMDEEHSKWWRRPLSTEEEENLSTTMADFEEAVKQVQPSSSREGFSTIPNVKWEDIGGLDRLREEFYRHIIRRLKYPELYEEFGLDMGMGFLLYGPPGCGKTLIAKAIASEAGVNFIHIQGPEFLNKYVGESELAVRTIFRRARTCSPCILFLDEVDALTTRRGEEGGWVVERLLNQLLTELDGGDQRQGVFVIGATNRPEVMDRAVLRPGRLGKHFYVPLPGPAERGLILQALARKKPIDPSVDLNAIGRMEACKNFSGADLASLMHEATMAALDEKLASNKSSLSTSPQTIKLTHFELVLTQISPSVSYEEKLYYDKLSESFKAA